MVTTPTMAASSVEDDSSSSLCRKARSLWLSDELSDLKEVERLYRQAWELKKQRLLSSEEHRADDRTEAGEKLALLLLQSGRCVEADALLQELGYSCRLASCVLDYSAEQHLPGDDCSAGDAPCRVYDNFLSPKEIDCLSSVFLDPNSSYWTSHGYQVEPPSPYFSYLIHLDSVEKFGCLGQLVRRLQSFLAETWKLALRQAVACELWAHNRPHATGHQFHFDSDNEGIDGVIRNPICSCILYLSEESVGGPSVITNQRLASHSPADKGWASQPRKGRLVAFDGKVLHGVVPGKGVPSATSRRRATVMLAFWRRIRVRDEKGFGAARPFPTQESWAQQLCWTTAEEKRKPTPVPVRPITLPRVYETVGGKAWTRSMGFPDYEQVFQGL